MNAFNIIKSDDGLSYRVEWNMHYITDEQADTIRAYIESLQSENAELRKELAVNEPLFETLNDANDRLLAENAELRELVRDMWHDARLLDTNGHIDGMRLSDSKAEDYKRRMRELGVEV